MSEVERLRQVYRAYDADMAVQARWDPENAGNVANAERRREDLIVLLKTNSFWPLTSRKILEIGCGEGDVLSLFRDLGATETNLHGVEIRPDALAKARQRLPQAQFLECDASALPFGDNTFDLVALFTVISSIDSKQMVASIARECDRVLQEGGVVVWYDMRFPNPSNLQVHRVSRSSIAHYFPGFRVDLRSTTLIPPLARRPGPLTSSVFPYLHAMPLLRSHWLGLLVKGKTL